MHVAGSTPNATTKEGEAPLEEKKDAASKSRSDFGVRVRADGGQERAQPSRGVVSVRLLQHA